MKIPVVFITDESYIVPTCVSIISLSINRAPNTSYEVSVIGISLSKRSIAILSSMTSAGVQVKVITITKNKYITHRSLWPGFHVSSAAMYKFDLMNIFPEYKKILYLDSDTIIQADLKKLFNIDVKDKYAAVVKDMKGMITNHYEKKYGLKNYFNSGVMLLNLQKMRKDKIFTKMMDLLSSQSKVLTFMDQDIFNLAFTEKVRFISLKYNNMVSNRRFSAKKIANFFDIDSSIYAKMRKNSAIIHYTDARKPWSHYFAPDSYIWKKYFKLFSYKGIQAKRRFLTDKDLYLVPRIVRKYKGLSGQLKNKCEK